MNYFDYVKSVKMSTMIEVFQVVQSLKGYAKTVYKGLWEEALDKSFFHIMQNYDESKGDLEHYATKIVGKISLNTYSHEITHDVVLDTSLNEEQLKKEQLYTEIDFFSEEDGEEKPSKDLVECVRYLAPSFVEDYRLFKTKKSSERKKDYKGIFSLFSFETIKQALDYLSDRYTSDIEELIEAGRARGIRGVTDNKLQKSLDAGIIYEGRINGILLYKKLKNSHSKVFYSLNLKKTINLLVNNFYKDEVRRKECHIYKNIEGCDVYCTLSGLIMVGEENLRDALEREVIARILNRSTFIKIVTYEKGEELLLSCTKELDCWIILDCFGTDFEIQFDRVIAKRIQEVNFAC